MRVSNKLRMAGVVLGAGLLLAGLMPVGLTANTPVTGAAFTTTNTAVDGTGHCKNGNEDVNCNIYDGKDFVWLNGGPSVAYVGDGSYFFAVLSPGGQPNPNDYATKNLSDDYDAYTDRTFEVSAGTVSYTGSHDFHGNKIRLMPYADTTNPGGVYILAICSLADGYEVDPSDCKYDAFKIREGAYEQGDPLSVSKDASGTYDNTYSWTITKDVDKTLVEKVGGTATFNYTITVSHDGGTISDVSVGGTITVFNPNPFNVTGDVTDVLSDGTVCAVTGGTNATFGPGDNDFAYSCDLSGLPQGELDNTASVSWAADAANKLPAGSADFIVEGISFTGNDIDECVSVDDSYAGHLGDVCVGGDNPKSFEYARTVEVPTWDCVSYDNTATFTANDTGATDSAGQTVTVCGPAKTGALTMGFWQNKNGQGIIRAGASTAGTCNSATWLRQYNPFKDLSATATCTATATYVYDIIKAANARGASMNKMLKAQMLATALDVYFSDPALGGNSIGAPAPIGGVSIDLTKICRNIGGGCTIYEDVSSAFGGATSMTVSAMLAYAASQSNAGGSAWYGQVKATQELAKDAFDAINNEKVFAP